jgi:hypothetical protein
LLRALRDLHPDLVVVGAKGWTVLEPFHRTRALVLSIRPACDVLVVGELDLNIGARVVR